MRTQIQLNEEDYEELRQVAARQRRSIADCIREGIRWVVRQSTMSSEDDSLLSIAGKFEPRPFDDLKAHDRAFVETASKRAGRPR